MFACIDAYTACFSRVEREDGFIRFCDAQLPDMYDHNFILLPPGLDLSLCEKIIGGEIQRRRAQGHNFCQVRLTPWPKQDLSLLSLPLTPEISRYVVYTSEQPENLRLKGRADCTVRQVATAEMVRDLIAIDRAGYEGRVDRDFLLRKGKRRAQVYLQPGGVDSFVCYQAGQPVGKADLLVHEGWAMIEDFDVIPSRQRQGFGAAILRALAGEAAARGAQSILLVTDAADTPKEMYQKLGFTEQPGRTALFFRWPG